jgi:rubrerythrin
MDLDKFTNEQIFLAGIKAEIGAYEIYTALAKTIDNAYMKDKMLFLAAQEEKHRKGLLMLYKKESGKKRVRVPAETPVPMPFIKTPGPGVLPSEVIQSAMNAEKNAEEFYTAFARRFPVGSEQAYLLVYFASMEKGHYQLLETEKGLLEKEEYYDNSFPMMHVGP